MERLRAMRLRWAMLLMLILPWASHAQTAVAKYAGEFLALGEGGRALGMGSASVAVAGDVTAGYWNPAGLARIQYPQLVLMHDEWFGSLVNHDYGAVAIPFGPQTSLGLSVIRVGVDDIPDTRNAGVDAAGNLTYDPAQFSRVDPSRVTYFTSADWAFLFTYARSVSEDFSYGGNLKLIRRVLDHHGATGVGIDIGFLYRVHERVMLGANLQDVTTTLLAWDTGRKELISPTLKLGAAGAIDALGGRFTPAVDFDIRFEGRKYAAMMHLGRISIDPHSGLEFQFKEVVALRVGYSDIKRMTYGAGVHLPKLNIDYSFVPFDGTDQLGNIHRISLLFTLESDQFKRPAE
ncbi:MAG TPA: PorV/PorQ family protein [Chloroflexota bacterium]